MPPATSAVRRELRTCHRDLWADNVRTSHDGGLCVFDFDNAGLADPSQELAMILVEGCRRRLTATTDDQRSDSKGWVREFLDRPLTRTVIERSWLIDARYRS